MIRFSYFAFLVLIFSCFANTKKKIKKKENPERFYLKTKIGELHKDNKYAYFSIITQLVNDTKDTINYLSMSCSWYEFYYVEAEQITFDEAGCNKNVPELVTLLPHSVDQERILKVSIQNSLKELHGFKFRVGFNFVPVGKNEDIFVKTEQQYKPAKNMIWERVKPTNMIWSDSLTIR